jgi:DNA-binding transcriptional LysR family regulator
MNAHRWADLQVRQVLALKAVAEHKTFGAAAAKLGYTQSAISQQIAALERIIGARLIERPRGRRPVGLTDAGEVMLRHAQALLDRLTAAQADVDEALAEPSVLRVGTYQSVSARIVPRLLKRFRQEWPDVEIILHETAAGDTELLAGVKDGALDLAFVMLPLPDGPFASIELLRDPYVLVVEASSPLASRTEAVCMDTLADLRLIGFRSCRNEQRVESHLRRCGIEPHFVFRSDDNATVQALVASGLGSALVPRLTVDTADPETVVLTLAEPPPPRLLGLVSHRDRGQTPAARAFVQLARTVTATDGRPSISSP